MAPPRTAAGHAAERLRVQLVSKLKGVSANPALSKQFYKAIALCDAFLHSCDNSEQGLERLKQEVKDAITASVPKRTKKAPTPKAPSRKDSQLSTTSGVSDKPSLWTLPVHRVELLAKQNTNNEYGMIAVQADEAARQERIDRKAKLKLEQKAIKKQLEEQMAVKREIRKKELVEKYREGEDIAKRVVEYQIEEEQKAVVEYQKAIKAKKERAQQVVEKKKKLASDKAKQLKEDQAFLRRVILENDEIKKKKAQAQKDKRVEMAKVQKENIEKLRQKELKRLDEQQKEVKLMQDYERSIEERAQRREAEIKAHQEKILAKYRAGGGESLQQDLKAREREDEERAMKYQMEHERKVNKMEKLNARKRSQQKKELKNYLQSQIHSLELAREREEKERAEYAREIKRSIEEDSLKAKDKARRVKEKNLQYSQDIIAQMKRDASKRYEAAADKMPHSEKVLNSNILQGKGMRQIF
ncbi:hypothetical protein HOP50_04g30370 [Chloropicon primus]|uniref:Trichohyalin-plectin-homology domain-containing protein n=2 Tax=Chloropicon primus TaxID=1764295 RepID=A0A5B8MJC9_9CHLO|nr:hypothetical protein A3770_04p30370 [Chloropicon primus]UPQ99729.1 hypothetical protein HOP50_04g30370 [Chloropicon primus]|eukprot:QDZ20519.1 hypothetical protein A3770_04p30370 [Chloropicon primus]